MRKILSRGFTPTPKLLSNKVGLVRKSLVRGFTLVELLIVIGLLGAIALIVIAAINPIEQANKARDARFRADASQLLSAIERYYASNSQFPWAVGCQGAGCSDPSLAFTFTLPSDPLVGLCATSACSAGGTLVTSDELKTEFLSRDWAHATVSTSSIMIGKAAGSSSSVYACFVPLAKASKDAALPSAKNGNVNRVRTISFTSGAVVPDQGGCTNSTTDNWATSGCYVCVPE